MEIYESICSLRGNISSSFYSAWVSTHHYSCIKPFSDYIEPCSSSTDCQGDCEYVGSFPPRFCTKVGKNEYRCAEDFKGTCSPYNYGLFDKWNEVEENRIIGHEAAIM